MIAPRERAENVGFAAGEGELAPVADAPAQPPP